MKNKTYLNTASRQETLAYLQQLRLPGMTAAYSAQFDNPNVEDLTFEQRFSMIVKEEFDQRTLKRKQRLIKISGMRERDCTNVSLESLIYTPERGLKKSVVMRLATCNWITADEPSSLLVCGASGTGKTWLIKSLGKCACENELTVAYFRYKDLAEELDRQRKQLTTEDFVAKLSKKKLLIIDDFAMGVSPSKALSDDLLSIFESRYGMAAMIVASQYHWENWYNWIGDPATADAIMDRLLNYSTKIELKGKSLRESKQVEQ